VVEHIEAWCIRS